MVIDFTQVLSCLGIGTRRDTGIDDRGTLLKSLEYNELGLHISHGLNQASF